MSSQDLIKRFLSTEEALVFDEVSGDILYHELDGYEGSDIDETFHLASDLDLDYLFGATLEDEDIIELACNGTDNPDRDEVIAILDDPKASWAWYSKQAVKTAWLRKEHSL